MTLSPELLLGALLAFAAIGWVSGFLGIGGGFLLIPVLDFVGRQGGLGEVTALKLAMGTALFISSLTALSGYFVHRRKSGVAGRRVAPLAVGVAAGAFAGARTTARWLGASLHPLFGVALLLAAVVFVIRREKGREDPFPGGPALLFAGLPIGFCAASVGLGGAVFTGLVFSGLLGYPIRRVVAATSLAQVCGGFLGWMGFAWAAFEGVVGLAPGSLGYVNLPAGIAALLVTWPLARLGAGAMHRTAPRWVRAIFALLLVLLGLKYILL